MINPGANGQFDYANFGIGNQNLPGWQSGFNISGTNENMGNAQAALYQQYQATGPGTQQGQSGYTDEGYYPMAGFEMPDFGAFMESMNASTIDFGAIYAQQAAAAARAQGIAQVSALYGAKFDAADKAISEVNQQIADEMAHAQLVGLDYNVDDASKQARINDIFANYWSEADEGQLTSLIGEYGDAGYTWDLPVVRGKSTEEAAKEKTPGKKAGKPVAAKPKGSTLATVETPLGSSAVLG